MNFVHNVQIVYKYKYSDKHNMANYIVDFTNINISPISIDEGDITSQIDVTLFGRIRLEYGEFLNENLLHLLENYACPENSINTGNPDLARSHNDLLNNPTTGQFWYNSTKSVLYQWDGSNWIPIRALDDVAANWGTVGHGQKLPRPISSKTGYEFPYDECIWSVSPAFYQTQFSSVRCGTTPDATAIMQYKISGTDTIINGVANYLIIGIRGNNNLGVLITPPPLVDNTPTPSNTPVPTQTNTPTPTPSNTPAPGASVTPTATQAVTPTQTEAITPTPNPTTTPNPTRTPTPSPTTSPPSNFGVSTRLYISPAICDPGIPGSGGGTNTEILDTCGQGITVSSFNQSLYISLQGIGGGTPPYTVNFSNLYPVIPLDQPGVDGTLELSYLGGDATGGPIRTNVSAGEITYARIRFIKDGSFNTCQEISANFQVSGYVILTDSLGLTQKWWVPDSSQSYPEAGYVAGCPIGGTNLIGDLPPVPGAQVSWKANWSHKPSCSDLTPGICGVRFYNNDANYFRSEDGLLDTDYTKMTLVFSFYGDAYDPGIYSASGSLFDAGNDTFEVGYRSDQGGWSIWLQELNNTIHRLDYTIYPGALAVGSWHAVMFAVDTSIPAAKLYVDGVMVKLWTSQIAGKTFKRVTPGLLGFATEQSTSGGINGRVSYIWAHNNYYEPAVHYYNFFSTSHKPKYIGKNGEIPVGVQPKSYFPYGDPTINMGTLPDWTEYGEVERVPGPNG